MTTILYNSRRIRGGGLGGGGLGGGGLGGGGGHVSAQRLIDLRE